MERDLNSTEPRPQYSELLEKVQHLEEKLERYEKKEERTRWVWRKAARTATEWHLGKEIAPASKDLVDALNQNLQDRKLEIPAEETGELVAAVTRRLIRVRAWALSFAFLGVAVATIPPALQWQSNKLLREQIQTSNSNFEKAVQAAGLGQRDRSPGPADRHHLRGGLPGVTSRKVCASGKSSS